MTPVWLFLVKARALQGNEMFAPGSEASVQCFVPGGPLEASLVALDQFLGQEQYRRLDLTIAHRYDIDDPEEDYPSENVQRGMKRVGEAHECGLGVVVYARESATLLGPGNV